MSTTCPGDTGSQAHATFSTTLRLQLQSSIHNEQLHAPLELEIKAHNCSPTMIDDPPKTSDSGSQYELHDIPTYLSDRTRRLSNLTRKDSDLSILKGTINLQTLSAVSTPSVLNIPPGDGIEVRPERCHDSISDSPTSISPRLSKIQKRNSIVQFLALCWCIFMLGWNDGSTGPLLPRIQEEYRVISSFYLYCIRGFLLSTPTRSVSLLYL
jgi:hypothetical protein